MCEYLDDLYAEISEGVLGIKSTSASLLNKKEFNLEAEEALRLSGLDFDHILTSEVPGNELHLAGNYGGGVDVRGYTVLYKKNDLRRSAVFILDEGESVISGVYKIISLLHELGHAYDFEKCINFDKEGVVSSLVRAEVYAEVFALKWLDRYKDSPVHRFVKSQYASALLFRKNASPFYCEVHKGINVYFTDKRINKWRIKL